MHEKDIQEKINYFLAHAPYDIRDGSADEQATYLMTQTVITNRIFPVAVETLLPLVNVYRNQ